MTDTALLPRGEDTREVFADRSTDRLPVETGAYGLPVAMLTRAWGIADIARYLGLGSTTVRHLMRDPSAPAPLRCGRGALRWGATQVLAWLHTDSIAKAPETEGSEPAASAQGGSRPTPRARVSFNSVGGPVLHVVDPAALADREREERLSLLLGDKSDPRPRLAAGQR